MDAITLDHLIREMAPVVTGRHLRRPRLVGRHAVAFEVSGEREHRLWLEAGRRAAGIYLLSREELRRLAAKGAEDDPPGRTRQAVLLLRKHLEGARLRSLGRIPGERTLVFDGGDARLVLKLSGPAPALTLVVSGTPRATIGHGSEAWPLPEPSPEREWDRIDPALLASAVASGREGGLSTPRAVLRACPSLGPLLARELDGSAESFAALRRRLSAPRPTVLAPGPKEAWRDRDLAPAEAVALAPIAIGRPGRVTIHLPSWRQAAAVFLEAHLRGSRFEKESGRALAGCRQLLRRLARLEDRLMRDLAGMPDASRLRREGEALLALAGPLASGSDWVEIPDPYESETRLRLEIDPGLTAPANAERRFDKARRIDRGRRQAEARLSQTRAALEAERDRERRLLEARDLEDLRPLGPHEPGAAPRGADRGPHHYLTTRGLTLLVGRGARENHHLTFTVARPDDVWLHARDVPGAHVILRDSEGRAGAEDLREAAEVAAFFSDARGQSRVDVHVARRKHVRPARGGPGRVIVSHSETRRVEPKGPEGRLRRR